jgi:hypothetical protein
MTELVSIREAATRLGVSADTVRRRLKRGELGGEQEATPQGFVWRVEVPVETQPTAPAEATNAAQAASVLVEDALEAARLRERVDGLERLVGELRGERDAWQAQAERHEGAARELRILVRQAQELSRALPATADSSNPHDHGSGRAETAPPIPRSGGQSIGDVLLRRLRRLLGGV